MTLRESLLFSLETHRDGDLSGQALARMLGVSRNAVWKAVEALRAEGFDILSAPRRGYRLADDCDRVSAAGIRAALPAALRALPIHFHDTVDSTNSQAKRLLADGLSGEALVVAAAQTAGRGRRGRSFYSPRDTGVYMTLILRPEGEVSDLVSLTAAAAVAVVRAIEGLTDARPAIKWVNDVYLEGKKLCGILTEAVTGLESGLVEGLVVGIGINVGTEDFPPELSGIAGSLRSHTLRKNRLIAAVAEELFRIAAHPEDKSYLADYRRRSMVLGRRVCFEQNGQRFEALATDIDDGGGLLVQLDDGSARTLRSGEITLRVSS